MGCVIIISATSCELYAYLYYHRQTLPHHVSWMWHMDLYNRFWMNQYAYMCCLHWCRCIPSGVRSLRTRMPHRCLAPVHSSRKCAPMEVVVTVKRWQESKSDTGDSAGWNGIGVSYCLESLLFGFLVQLFRWVANPSHQLSYWSH